MALLSQTGFAKLAGISQAAISKALKTGRLVYESDGELKGINPDNPLSRSFLESTNSQRPKFEPETISQPKVRTNAPIGENSGQITRQTRRPIDYGNIADRRAHDDILKSKLLELKVDRERRARLISLKQIIPVDIVRRGWTNLGFALQDNLRNLPERISGKLEAMARAGASEPEFRIFLGHEIEKALERLVVEFTRETEILEQEDIDG